MSTITIDVRSNVAGLHDAAKKAPAKFEQAYDRLGQRAASELARKAKNEAPQHDGALINSITHQRITLGQWVAGTPMPYAPHVEEGTNGGGFVPMQTLVEWIKRKRLVSRNPRVDRDGLAFLIQRSIYTKGTKANPFMARTEAAMRPRVQQIFDAGLQKVVDDVVSGA